MQSLTGRYQILRASALLVFAFLIVSDTLAQSGRRPPKKSDPPAPVQPSSEPEPEAKPAAKPEAPLIPLAIMNEASLGGDESFYSKPLVESCADRLKKAARFTIEVARQTKNRKEASDYAKSSAQVYVVWMELRFNSYSRRGYVRQGDSDSYQVDYVLYEPSTGKMKTSGRVYQRPYNSGGPTIPVPTTGATIPLELSIRQAGEDVADRILSAMNLSPLPRH